MDLERKKEIAEFLKDHLRISVHVSKTYYEDSANVRVVLQLMDPETQQWNEIASEMDYLP